MKQKAAKSRYDNYDEPVESNKKFHKIHSLAGECVFCGIVQEKSKLVYEDDFVAIFEDIK